MTIRYPADAVAPDPDGVPNDIEIAEIYPDGPAEALIQAGWYWRRTTGNRQGESETARTHAWKTAVRAGQGPYRSGAEAIRGSEQWTPARRIAVERLQQAAELVRSGEVAPDGATVGMLVEKLIQRTRPETLEADGAHRA